MRGVLKWLFGGDSSETESGAGAAAEVQSQPPECLIAGQVYSFRTSPYSEFAPPSTGRFAAFKLLGVSEKHIAVAVLDGIWASAPALKDVGGKTILHEHRFAHTGRPAVFGVQREWWKPETDLTDFKFVGMQRVSPSEQSFVDAIARHAVGSRFASIHHVNYSAEGEWRWEHERDSFVEEIALRDAKNGAERAAKEERYRTRLSKLTWEQLLSETQFERWSPSPPYPPQDFTDAARDVIREACVALLRLGPKPRKAEVRAILKKTVLWFNEADERAGGVIETEEREDICAALEEMAYVARHKSLVDEIDEWRDW